MWRALGSPEIKVGALVVTVSGLIGVMATKVAEGPGFFSGGQNTYTFHADSAGGLVPNSAVKMAGIKIGLIREIILEDGRAKIVIGVNRDAKVGQHAKVFLKSDGILGDKHVEMTPGPADDPELPPGGEIALADKTSDDVMSEVGKVTKSLNEFVATLNDSVKQGSMDSRIGRILANIESITADLKQVTGSNKGKISEIVDRVNHLAANVDHYLNEETFAHLNHALKNVDEVTGKINKGEGTLGRLVNDEKTVDQINTAVENVNRFLGAANSLETSIDFHSEFLSNNGNKTFLGARLQPGLDRYYEIAIVSDSKGVVHTKEVDSVIDGVSHTDQETTTYKNKFAITGLFAKNFWDFTLKAGVIENYGGAGLDYFVAGNRNLRFSVEAYNFQQLQLRTFLRYNIFKGIYAVGGGDNLLSNADGTASYFVGAGVFLTNDDLKTFATRISL